MINSYRFEKKFRIILCVSGLFMSVLGFWYADCKNIIGLLKNTKF